MTEFLPFNARPLRTLENYSGTRVDKITWVGTGWNKLVRKYDSYGKDHKTTEPTHVNFI